MAQRSTANLGGSADDSGVAIALDPNANLYVTGVTSSFDFPVTPGTVQAGPGGGTDAFFAQIGFLSPFNRAAPDQVPATRTLEQPKAGSSSPRDRAKPSLGR